MTEIQEYQDHAEVAGNDLKKRKKMIFITIAATLAILTIYAVFAAYQSMYAHANNIKYTQLEINPDTDLEEAQLNIFLERMRVFQSAIDIQKVVTGTVDQDLYMALATDARLIRDYELEISVYEELLVQNPLYYVAWNNYAGTLERLGDLEGAEDAFLQAIQLRGAQEYYRDYVTFLENNYGEERADEQFAILEEYVQREGQTTWGMVTIAEWHLAYGDCNEALNHYEVAMQLSPDSEAIVKDYNKAKSECR